MTKNKTLLLLFFIPLFAHSQTARWIVKPEYNKIAPISETLLKVEKDGAFGVMDYNGIIKAPCEFDKITDFCDHVCLLLKGDQLKGIMDDMGNVKNTEGEYRIGEYPYYSEGLLNVKSNGKWGFIDKGGNERIKCRYVMVNPFSFGKAVVRNKEGGKEFYAYINAEGTLLPFIGSPTVLFATSFVEDKNDGTLTALYQVKDKYIFIDKDLSVNKKYPKINKSDSKARADKKGRYITVYDKGKEVFEGKVSPEVIQYQTNSNTNISTDQQNGLFSLNSGDTELLPCQFTSILPLANNLTIAAINDRYGVIKINPAGKVDLAPRENSLVFYHNTPIPVNIDCKLPDGIQPDRFKMKIQEIQSKKAYTNDAPDNTLYSFDYCATATEATKYDIQFQADYTIEDLKYPTKKLDFTVECKVGFSITIPQSVQADTEDRATINIAITNNSRQNSAPCDIYINGQSAGSGITINAGERKNISRTIDANFADEDYIAYKITAKVAEQNFIPISKSESVTIKRTYKEE